MNLVKKIGVVLIGTMIALSVAGPIFAQVEDKVHRQNVEKAEATAKNHLAPFGGPGIGAGIGAGLVIIGAAMGFGKIGAAALESMARQPETAGRVQTAMIIIGALLEGATFFALIICIQLAGKA